jgi:hypothetical protein
MLRIRCLEVVFELHVVKETQNEPFRVVEWHQNHMSLVVAINR